MIKRVLMAGLCSALIAPQAEAHSGGLDRNGCHAGSQPYHCHRGGGSSGSSAPSFSQPFTSQQAAPQAARPATTSKKPCQMFSSEIESQLFLDKHGDRFKTQLDPDGNGIACDHEGAN